MGVRWEEPGLNKEGIVSPERLWDQRSGSQAVLFAQLCSAAVISVSLRLCRGAAVRRSFKGPASSCPEMSASRMCFFGNSAAQEVGVCLYSYSLIMFEWRERVCLDTVITLDRGTFDSCKADRGNSLIYMWFLKAETDIFSSKL